MTFVVSGPEQSLCDLATDMVAASRTLRNYRASLGRQRREALAEHQTLRMQANVLSHTCRERRAALQTAIDRWGYVSRFFTSAVPPTRVPTLIPSVPMPRPAGS